MFRLALLPFSTGVPMISVFVISASISRVTSLCMLYHNHWHVAVTNGIIREWSAPRSVTDGIKSLKEGCQDSSSRSITLSLQLTLYPGLSINSILMQVDGSSNLRSKARRWTSKVDVRLPFLENCQ